MTRLALLLCGTLHAMMYTNSYIMEGTVRSVGVREVRHHLSQVLKELSEGGEEISITSYGKEIARLVPPRKRRTPADMAKLWSHIDGIAAKIGQYPDNGMSAVDAVREERE